MKYRITDKQSGKTLVISGDSPPTEQEAEELFNQSGVRQEKAPKLTPRTEEEKQQILSKQIPVSQVMPEKLNPLVEAAGKTQEFLGTSQVLPTAYSAIGKILFPSPGTGSGGGAMVGETLKQGLAEGGPQALLKMLVPMLKTNKEKLDVLKSGAIAGGSDIVLSGLFKGGKKVGEDVIDYGKTAVENKTINPIKILSSQRGKLEEKAGKLITNQLMEAGDEYTKMNPFAADDWETLRKTITPDMTAKELGERMKEVFSQAYTRGGDVRSTSLAGLMNHLYNAGREVIKTQAPEIAGKTAGLRFLFEAPEVLQKASWLGAKAGLIKNLFGL